MKDATREALTRQAAEEAARQASIDLVPVEGADEPQTTTCATTRQEKPQRSQDGRQ